MCNKGVCKACEVCEMRVWDVRYVMRVCVGYV